jgi:hypothetical protein
MGCVEPSEEPLLVEQNTAGPDGDHETMNIRGIEVLTSVL